MKTVICNGDRFFPVLLSLLFSVIIVLNSSDSHSQENELLDEINTVIESSSKITYRNPRVYNVDYSFELFLDSAKIDRAKDLKLWIPIPRNWDSQKGVKIISVQPPPHAEYEDPEHGNRMFFWDFGKEPEKSSYKVDITFLLESYEVQAEVHPELVGQYDKSNKQYALYTRSSHTVTITPMIRKMAQEAVGDEKNPYLQAKQIFEFVGKKMRYEIIDFERGRGVKCLLDYPVMDEETGEEHYKGSCNQYSVFFVAMCRAVGIPARSVSGFIGWQPWIKEEDSRAIYKFETKLSPDGLAGVQHYGAQFAHMWSEFYIPNYGWIPIDGTYRKFGHTDNKKVILSKGRDVKVGPHTAQKQSEGYGSQWVELHNGRADFPFSGIWNITKIRKAKVEILHSAPFPFVKYFVYFLTVIILSIVAGGFAGFICFHKFKKYAFVGLANIVPIISLALPVIFIKKEEQKIGSKVGFVSLF